MQNKSSFRNVVKNVEKKSPQTTYTFRKEDIFDIGVVTDIITKNQGLGLEKLLSLGLNTETVIPLRHDNTTQNLPLLHAAAKSSNIWLVRILIRHGVKLDHKDQRGRTALFYADEPIASLLIDCGANVNAKLRDGTSVLHYFSKLGDESMMFLLLNSNADVHQRTKTGMTPLHYAALSNGKTEAVKLLLNHNADINAKMDENLTPLHLCLMYGDWKTAAVLIDRNADFDAQDNFGRSSLHIATSLGLTRACLVMILSGADVHIKDREIRTPNTIAKILMNRRVNPYQLRNEELHRLFHPRNLFTVTDYNESLDFEHSCIMSIDKNGKYVVESSFLDDFKHYIELAETMHKTLTLKNEDLEVMIEAEDVREIDSPMAKEVKSMRSNVIDDGITFYDILTENYKKVAEYFTNEKVAATLLDSEKFKESYYFYNYLFKKKINTAEEYYRKNKTDFNVTYDFKKTFDDSTCESTHSSKVSDKIVAFSKFMYMKTCCDIL